MPPQRPPASKPAFFANPALWRRWLEENHGRHSELLVGFYRKDSGFPSITWPESVDAALCFGWIDGIRRNIDAVSYSIRFTPRKPASTWSAVNIKRAAELTELGLMHPAGLRAFAARKDSASAIYAYEQRKIDLEPAQLLRFQANPAAWEFFQSKPPSYRRTATWWVISAKRPETREKRLSTLIADSQAGRTLAHLTPTPRP